MSQFNFDPIIEEKKSPSNFFKIEGFINIWEGSIPKSGMNISFGVCLFIYF